MIQICEKLTIKDYSIESINEGLNMCEHCKYYCDAVLELDEKKARCNNESKH